MNLFDFFRGNKIVLKIILSKRIRVDRQKDRITFIGTRDDILTFAAEIRKISRLNDGELAKVGCYFFKLSNFITADQFRENWVELSGLGWNVMASKFSEVVYGYEQNPFYFNDCGFTTKLPLDIGVKVIDLENG